MVKTHRQGCITGRVPFCIKWTAYFIQICSRDQDYSEAQVLVQEDHTYIPPSPNFPKGILVKSSKHNAASGHIWRKLHACMRCMWDCLTSNLGNFPTYHHIFKLVPLWEYFIFFHVCNQKNQYQSDAQQKH